ncbi:hypothetical protein IG197_10310 [Aminobacter sp. SR38]|jgi:hypothetical protein|uniref:hypothetical protein n=1 Tax=Aminobacter sp. SR38 TaxID=2774562 RepID=UPI00177AD1D0|nr:hypothetical protein [Aminobacter sp. SR38]QOF73406.1 hypothetical protein IG197_10310 [Aminobacter sp. SR38]
MTSTLMSPAYIASDRRLTLGNGGKEYYPVANKAVVYRARNAVATRGYSGIAYIEGMPTDDWIVRALRRQRSAFDLLDLRA